MTIALVKRTLLAKHRRNRARGRSDSDTRVVSMKGRWDRYVGSNSLNGMRWKIFGVTECKTPDCS